MDRSTTAYVPRRVCPAQAARPLRRRLAELLALYCVVAGAVAGGVAAGCSSSNRRLSERDTLQYKLQLARERRAEISPAKVDKLLYHPARTPREIDRAFDDLAREHALEVARDSAEQARVAEAERKARAEEAAAEAATDGEASPVKDASGGDAKNPSPPDGSSDSTP